MITSTQRLASDKNIEIIKRVASKLQDSNANKWMDCLYILIGWAIPLLFIHPFQNFPYIDDWTYAWPVEQLLQHQKLRVLEWSSSPNVTQALWGSLFCLPWGFSFAALKFSTWLLALGCLWGLYLLLRELGVSRKLSLLGTAALAVNPIFFNLSFSFMTDIPFITLEVWALLFLVKGFKTDQFYWFLAASFFSALSISIRPVGIAFPAAALLMLVLSRKHFNIGWIIFVIGFSILSALVIFFWWSTHQYSSAVISDFPGIPKTRLKWLEYSIPALPNTFPSGLIFILAFIGINFFPLTVASIHKNTIIRSLPIFLFMLFLFLAVRALHISFTIPLSVGSIWEWKGFEASQELVPNALTGVNPPWIQITVILGMFSSAIIFHRIKFNMKVPIENAFILSLCFVHFALIVILWLFNDRYALVIIPLLIALYLPMSKNIQLITASAILFCFLCFSVIATHNMLNYNQALWLSYNRLRESGTAGNNIDGGYVVNGWLQYAHPANAPRDQNGKVFVPGMTTSNKFLKYRISNQPQLGYDIVSTLTYTQWFKKSGKMYVLKIAPSKENKSSPSLSQSPVPVRAI